MLRRIVLWLLDWLRESLDPELRARLDAYRAERERVTALIADEARSLAQDNQRLEQIRAERSAVAAHLAQVETEIAKLKEEVEKIDAETNHAGALTDADALRRL